MREYETTVIVQPEISSDGTEAILQKMDSALERGGSTRLMCADLGKRKLAYEIHKFQKGHYYTLSFADQGQVIPDLERVLRMEESVLRFMTVMIDDAVTDLEVRKERGRELEIEQQKRAAAKRAREAEEARARDDVERLAAETAAAETAAAETAAAETAAAETAAEAADSSDSADSQEAAVADAAAADEPEPTAIDAAPESEGSPAEEEAAAPEDAGDSGAEDGEKS